MKNFFKQQQHRFERYVEKRSYPYVVFGFFCVITYPVYYFIWHFTNSTGYDNIYLRMGAVLLAIPLVLKNYWPKKIIPLLPIYWYVTVAYCFPFLFSYFLLRNNYSLPAIFNALSILMLSILVLDLMSLIVVLFFGISSGYLVYYLSRSGIPPAANSKYLIIVFISFLLNGAIFAQVKESIHASKIKALITFGSAIAHELRTPLRSIGICVADIKVRVERFFDGVRGVKRVADLDFGEIEKIVPDADDIAAETYAAFSFIEMLLTKVDEEKISKTPLSRLSIKNTINEALTRYPYDLKERSIVHFDEKNDFVINANEDLMIHVIFNLLKNAFHFIKAAGKGEIFLSLRKGENENILLFKDTGTGIAKRKLKKIFERFYSETRHGTGIGLSFCKLVMKNLGGDIICKSEKGKFTEFVLTFPFVS